MAHFPQPKVDSQHPNGKPTSAVFWVAIDPNQKRTDKATKYNWNRSAKCNQSIHPPQKNKKKEKKRKKRAAHQWLQRFFAYRGPVHESYETSSLCRKICPFGWQSAFISEFDAVVRCKEGSAVETDVFVEWLSNIMRTNAGEKKLRSLRKTQKNDGADPHKRKPLFKKFTFRIRKKIVKVIFFAAECHVWMKPSIGQKASLHKLFKYTLVFFQNTWKNNHHRVHTEYQHFFWSASRGDCFKERSPASMFSSTSVLNNSFQLSQSNCRIGNQLRFASTKRY